MVGGIPDKLKAFICYNQSSQMVGVADLTLPTLSHMSDSISGAGLLGEIDTEIVKNSLLLKLINLN